MKNKNTILILGDIITIVIITIIGFATHGEKGVSFLPRMATTIFPMSIGWFLIAPWFGLFNEKVTSIPKLLWRIPLAMILCAPLAVILRAALLGTAALPIFTLILGSTSAFGMLVWRGFFLYLRRRV